ncbi:MAG: glycosyltransferase family 9 protein [Elusimicrobiota bacterium]|jgi:heptosyltransferase-2|nr:glycosyltransferase family 9 protein [Elusimicrobiota bacterium]
MQNYLKLKTASKKKDKNLKYFVQKNVKKILIIRFSSLGDVILSTIFIEALFEKYKLDKNEKNLEIFVLTKTPYDAVFANNPNIKKVFTTESKEIFKTIKIIKKFQKEFGKIDLIFDLSFNLKSILISLFLNTKTIRISKNIIKRRILILVHSKKIKNLLKINNNFISIKQKYSQTFLPYKINSKLYLSDKELSFAKFSKIANYNEQNFYIGINTSANWDTKKWIIENYIELIQKLLKNKNKNKIVLLGGQKEILFNKKIVEKIDFKDENFIDLTGKTTIRELFAVVSLLNLVFTTDSAILHISQSFNKPTLAIFGPTVSEFGFWDKGENDFLFEIQNLACRPCSLHGTKTCPAKYSHHDCMKKIDVSDVYKKIVHFANTIF